MCRWAWPASCGRGQPEWWAWPARWAWSPAVASLIEEVVVQGRIDVLIRKMAGRDVCNDDSGYSEYDNHHHTQCPLHRQNSHVVTLSINLCLA